MAVQFGPRFLPTIPADANHVFVTSLGGSPVSLHTGVALDTAGRVSFAVQEPGIYRVEARDSNNLGEIYVLELQVNGVVNYYGTIYQYINNQLGGVAQALDDLDALELELSAVKTRTDVRAEGIGEHVHNVRDYGAIGNGVVNDTAAIQATINAAGEQGIVFFPEGTYHVNGQLNVSNAIKLVGASKKTTLWFYGTATGSSYGVSVSGLEASGFSISDLSLSGNARALLLFSDTSLFRVDNLIFNESQSSGIYIEGCHDFSLSHVDMFNNGILNAVGTDDPYGSSVVIRDSSQAHINRLQVELPRSAAIYAESSSHIVFRDSKVDGTLDTTPSIDPFIVIDSSDIEFTGLTLYGFRTAPVELLGLAPSVSISDFDVRDGVADAVVRAVDVVHDVELAGGAAGATELASVSLRRGKITSQSATATARNIRGAVYSRAPEPVFAPNSEPTPLQLSSGAVLTGSRWQANLRYSNGVGGWIWPTVDNQYAGSWLTNAVTGVKARILDSFSDTSRIRAYTTDTASFADGELYRLETLEEPGVDITVEDVTVPYRTAPSMSNFSLTTDLGEVTVTSSNYSTFVTTLSMTATASADFVGMFLYKPTTDEYFLIRSVIDDQLKLDYDVTAKVTPGTYRVRAGRPRGSFRWAGSAADPSIARINTALAATKDEVLAELAEFQSDISNDLSAFGTSVESSALVAASALSTAASAVSAANLAGKIFVLDTEPEPALETPGALWLDTRDPGAGTEQTGVTLRANFFTDPFAAGTFSHSTADYIIDKRNDLTDGRVYYAERLTTGAAQYRILTGHSPGLRASTTYTIVLDVKASAGSLMYHPRSASTSNTVGIGSIATAGAWQTLTFTFTTNSISPIDPAISFWQAGSTPAGSITKARNIAIFEGTPTDLSVFSGDTTGSGGIIYSWAGAPLVSTSVETMVRERFPVALRTWDGSSWANYFPDDTPRRPYVTPEMFGAVGDGITDDTTAIQAALDKKMDVVLGPKWYLTTARLVVHEGCSIRGAGSGNYFPWAEDEDSVTRIIAAANGNDVAVEVKTGGNIADLIVQAHTRVSYELATYPSSTNNVLVGVLLGGGASATRVTSIYFAQDAMRIGTTCKVNDCWVGFSPTGIYCAGADGWIYGTSAMFCQNFGIDIHGAFWRLFGNRLEWNARYGVNAGGETTTLGNLFDRNGWAGLLLTSGGWGHVVTGNYFSRNGAGGNGTEGRWGFSVPGNPSYVETPIEQSCHIEINYQRAVSITGNRFRQGADDTDTGMWAPAFIFSSVSANGTTPANTISVAGNAGLLDSDGRGFNSDAYGPNTGGIAGGTDTALKTTLNRLSGNSLLAGAIAPYRNVSNVASLVIPVRKGSSGMALITSGTSGSEGQGVVYFTRRTGTTGSGFTAVENKIGTALSSATLAGGTTEDTLTVTLSGTRWSNYILIYSD